MAAAEIYDNGAGYTGAKHAQSALHRTLRGGLLGQPVRLTEVLPGLVETEFPLRPALGDDLGAGVELHAPGLWMWFWPNAVGVVIGVVFA